MDRERGTGAFVDGRWELAGSPPTPPQTVRGAGTGEGDSVFQCRCSYATNGVAPEGVSRRGRPARRDNKESSRDVHDGHALWPD